MSSSANHSSSDSHEGGPTLSGYRTGFVAALVLTLIPFALVALGWFSTVTTLLVVALAGAVQILVHLRYFLHLDMSEEQRWNTISAAFAIVIIFVLLGGTIWLFFSLHFRMMGEHVATRTTALDGRQLVAHALPAPPTRESRPYSPGFGEQSRRDIDLGRFAG